LLSRFVCVYLVYISQGAAGGALAGCYEPSCQMLLFPYTQASSHVIAWFRPQVVRTRHSFVQSERPGDVSMHYCAQCCALTGTGLQGYRYVLGTIIAAIAAMMRHRWKRPGGITIYRYIYCNHGGFGFAASHPLEEYHPPLSSTTTLNSIYTIIRQGIPSGTTLSLGCGSPHARTRRTRTPVTSS
jgi:hypothetical protein